MAEAEPPPSEIRERVLDDHRALRQMLDRMEVLARRLLQGHGNLIEELRDQTRELRERLREHMALEERLLVPALADADAWGPERVKRFHEEHTRQREILAAADGHDLQRASGDYGFALLVWGLVRLLREDMEEEERISLNESVLRDTPIHSPEPE